VAGTEEMIVERTFDVLREYDVNLCEYYVICAVDDVGGMLFEGDLARESFAGSQGDPRGEFSLAEHRDAIHSCLRKKLLEELTTAKCQQESERRRTSRTPEIVESELRPGVVDFTETGYRLFRQIIVRIFGIEHIRHSDSGWNIDEDKNQVNVYAETKELCWDRIAELQSDPSSYIGATVRIGNISDPEPIGPWKPNRFLVVPRGFYGRVCYELIQSGEYDRSVD
jgi:hypothetical protein